MPQSLRPLKSFTETSTSIQREGERDREREREKGRKGGRKKRGRKEGKKEGKEGGRKGGRERGREDIVDYKRGVWSQAWKQHISPLPTSHCPEQVT